MTPITPGSTWSIHSRPCAARVRFRVLSVDGSAVSVEYEASGMRRTIERRTLERGLRGARLESSPECAAPAVSPARPNYRHARVRDLHRQGMPVATIAERMGITRHWVETIVSRGKRSSAGRE